MCKSTFRKFKNYVRNNMVLSRIYLKLNELKIDRIKNSTIRKLRLLENLSDEEVREIQNEKLIELLRYAYKNTGYYKKIFDELGVDPNKVGDFNKIPFLDKKKINENTTSLVSRQYPLESLSQKRTSGSTGSPLHFYCNSDAGLIDFGHHWYLYSLMGHEKGDIILTGNGSNIPHDLRDKNVFWTKNKNGNVFGDYMFSALYVTNETIDYYIDKLIDIKPAILRGYPSFFCYLAQYIIERNIVLDFTIKGINLTSEMCSESQRIVIEKAFSSMVYFEYGHADVCLFYYTRDETYTYKSSPIYGYTEVLDDGGNPTKVGQIGNIIATGFNNRGMPFIRYKTGDLGEVSFRNGGVVHFKKIYGRSQDYLISSKNEKILLGPLIAGAHLPAFENILKWQILQNELGKIIIRIIKTSEYSASDEHEIANKIREVPYLNVSFEYVDQIPLTKNGKHLFCIQNLTV